MDTKKRLEVAFLWHMHQPYYKDPLTGKYHMPWVRLHGIKDYFPMAALLEKFDNVKASFNLVPVLIEQINDYANNDATDLLLDLTLKKASHLTHEERSQVLGNFFKVNFHRFVEPNPRYSDLLMKRGVQNPSPKEIKKAAAAFTTQEFLDLQVLFNLAWFHSITVEEDINLGDLMVKGRDYTEQDKRYVVFKQREVMSQILPLYKKLQDQGTIEITTTPYYHPILPLLCDTEIAKTSGPWMKLPKHKFSHPEDADWHIREGLRYCDEQFNRRPRGMWPSEGSVSDEVLGLMIANKVDWIAMDEDILFKSLTHYDKKFKDMSLFDRRLVYQPYKFRKGSKSLGLIFRDKNLSNMISFSYNSWDQKAAAEDLVSHFKAIREHLRRDADLGLVTIAMDGENAWEFFADNGRTFFETLYAHLDGSDSLSSTTVSDFLDRQPPTRTLSHIFPGSWINHNFEVWIGQEQDNVSWEYLYKVRKDLERITKRLTAKGEGEGEALRKAWQELHIAEGSDWNWWYNGKAHVGNDNPFDPLYRLHLKNIYKILKKPIPDFLKISIA